MGASPPRGARDDTRRLRAVNGVRGATTGPLEIRASLGSATAPPLLPGPPRKDFSPGRDP
jgi:hypothetical protein